MSLVTFKMCSDSDDNLTDLWLHCEPDNCKGSIHKLTGGTATPCDAYSDIDDVKQSAFEQCCNDKCSTYLLTRTVHVWT